MNDVDDIITYDLNVIYAQKDDYQETSFYAKTNDKLQAIFERFDCFKGTIDVTNLTVVHFKQQGNSHTGSISSEPSRVSISVSSSSYTKTTTITNNAGHFYSQRRHQSSQFNVKYYSGGRKMVVSKPKLIVSNDDKMISMTRDCLNKLTKDNYRKMCVKIFLQVDNSNVIPTLNLIFNTCFKSSVYNDLYISIIFYLFDRSMDTTIKNSVTDVINQHLADMMNIDAYRIEEMLNESYDFFCDRVKKNNTIISKTRSIMYCFQNTDIMSCLKPTINEFCINLVDMLLCNDVGITTSVTIVECLIECFAHKSDIEFLSVENIAWKKLIDLKNSELEKLKAFVREHISFGTSKLKFKCIDLEEALLSYLQ